MAQTLTVRTRVPWWLWPLIAGLAAAAFLGIRFDYDAAAGWLARRVRIDVA